MNELVAYLYDRFKVLLNFDYHRLTAFRLMRYRNAIRAQVDNDQLQTIGFINV